MDVDIRYLGITLLLLAVIAAGHNYRTTTADAADFGYCSTELYCAGVEVSGACIGAEQLDTSCVDPKEAAQYRDVEARCGALAQNLCTGDEYTGTEWASETNVSGQSCAAWSQQDERIDLLQCSQTTPPAQQWEDIN